MKLIALSATLALFTASLGSLARAAAPSTSHPETPTHAAPAQPGTITGRIYSPVVKEYLRNAQLRIEETGQTTVSEGEGRFLLGPVSAGRYTVVVTYTGYRPVTLTVDVAAGATVDRDIELASSMHASLPAEEAMRLPEFTVSTLREGSGKAIMDQRNSMNITNIVASDIFGDDAEGNLGEFLKHLPGVEADTAFGEVRTIGLRGLGSEYTSVTIDGMSMNTADPTLQGATNSRAFTFETVSLSSMEAVEISKTVSADQDANAPAGTINLRTKRAFDRPGRRISWQANLAAHSEALSLKKTMGPDERQTHKLRPGGQLEYSDVFFDKRLGIVMTVSGSNLYQESSSSTLTFDRTPTTADPRPQVITQLSFGASQRLNERFSATFTADYKASRDLVLSLGMIYNWSELWQYGRTALFQAGARNTVVATDPLVSFRSNSTAALAAGRPSGTAKLGQSFTLTPKFEYKWRGIAFEGKLALSRSHAWYDPKNRQGAAADVGTSAMRGIGFRAERDSSDAFDWRITQVSGADIGNGYTDTSVAAMNDGRTSRRNTYGGQLTATATTRFVLPIIWKAGFKSQYEFYNYGNTGALNQYSYAPNGTNIGWNSFKSPYPYELGMTNTTITSLSGQGIFMGDLIAMGARFRDNPGAFVSTITPANYTTALITSPRRYEETVDAAFLMGTTKLGKASLRAGLRWEQTSGDSTELAQLSAAEVRAAGFAVGANGRATTIPGLEYQYFTRPRAHRVSEYDDFFPSASFKYPLGTNFDLQVGYSRTIRRPAFKDVAGFFNVNEQTRVVAAPNINLDPEYSDNVSARLAYYFEPVGILALNLYQNQVDGLMITNTLSEEQFGYNGPEDYSGYEFQTTTNSDGTIRIQGVELEYSQSLSFLPGVFKGLGVRASFTHNSAETVVPDLVPNAASAGINYAYRRFSAYVNGLWKDDVPIVVDERSYRRHFVTLDASTSFKLTRDMSLFLSARNLTNAKLITMDRFPPNAPVWRSYQINGITLTCGIKGRF